MNKNKNYLIEKYPTITKENGIESKFNVLNELLSVAI